MQMQPNIFIYTLANPITGEVRYVGKTNNMALRLRQHLCVKDSTIKSRWIHTLLKKGVRPVMELLDVATKDNWEELECYWIAQLKAWGIFLLNIETGGKSIQGRPASVREKITYALTGKAQFHSCIAYAQYTLAGTFIKVFDSGKAASDSINQQKNAVGTAAKRKAHAGGYLWHKVENGIYPEFLKSHIDSKGKLLSKKRTVTKEQVLRLQKTTNKSKRTVSQSDKSGVVLAVYQSVQAAALALKASAGNISMACNGKRPNAHGFKWAFIDEPLSVGHFMPARLAAKFFFMPN